MINKVLFIIYYSKIANTGHHSCMFSVVYNKIQKITNILIKKPIILISILNKYLDIPIYLDNRTPLVIMCKNACCCKFGLTNHEDPPIFPCDHKSCQANNSIENVYRIFEYLFIKNYY